MKKVKKVKLNLPINVQWINFLQIVKSMENKENRQLADKYISYKITILMGTKENSGDFDFLLIRLIGESKKKTNQMRIDLKNKTGMLEFKALNIGELKKIEVVHEGAGSNKNWLETSIKIEKIYKIDNENRLKIYLVSCKEGLRIEKVDNNSIKTIRMFSIDDTNK